MQPSFGASEAINATYYTRRLTEILSNEINFRLNNINVHNTIFLTIVNENVTIIIFIFFWNKIISNIVLFIYFIDTYKILKIQKKIEKDSNNITFLFFIFFFFEDNAI